MPYHVRQYRPNYFSGYDNEVVHNIEYADILSVPWCENFKSDLFDHFSISKYNEDELIIEAHYKNREHWVVGFAVDTKNAFAQNWRYKK